MIDLSVYHGKNIAVMGLGKTGMAAALALKAAGAKILAWDDNENSRHNAESFGFRCVDLSSLKHGDVEFIIWSPGIPHTYPTPNPVAVNAAAQNIPLKSDIDILSLAVPHADYIGITGTNGKSTTTALLAHTLKEFRPAQMGGNIGMPVLDLEAMDERGTFVLEMSSYQTELSCDFNPSGVILLNITPDHLNRHGGMDGYIAAKKEIFKNPKLGARKPVAVISIDTEECFDIAEELDEDNIWQVIPVSTQKRLDKGVYVEEGKLYEVREAGAEFIADLNEFTHLRGRHNHENIAAAYAIIRHLYGVEPHHIIDAMKSFGGLPHRQYLVRKINGVSFVNDSKATNADAASYALASFHDIYWIIGGQPKEGGLNGLEKYMGRVKKAYLIGEAAPQFAAWLSENNVLFEQCAVLENAVRAAADDAFTAGQGVVLLSPACASWDQFKSFEHRGQVFSELVSNL